MLQPSTLKKIEKLKRRKHREAMSLFLLEGIKGIKEAMDAHAEIVELIIEDKRRNEREIAGILAAAEKTEIEISFANQSEIGKIKSMDTFPGVLAIVRKSESASAVSEGPILILDGIQDPGNLGTIIRTADWFGVGHIILGKGTVDLYNEKVVRATMGSIFRSTVSQDVDLTELISTLQKEGYAIHALATGGRDIKTLKGERKSAYILGSESRGVSKELLKMSDKIVSIEGQGEAESLNVAIATGILLHYISV